LLKTQKGTRSLKKKIKESIRRWKEKKKNFVFAIEASIELSFHNFISLGSRQGLWP